MTIRPATIDDLPYIINLAADMHAESRYRNLTFRADRLGHLAAMMIGDDDGLVLVAEHQGDIVGGMIAQVMRNHWFAGEPVAYEYGVFIQPEHRGRMMGVTMVKRFVAWAEEKGAAMIDLAITTGITAPRTGAIYEKLGFAKVGAIYSKEQT